MARLIGEYETEEKEEREHVEYLLKEIEYVEHILEEQDCLEPLLGYQEYINLYPQFLDNKPENKNRYLKRLIKEVCDTYEEKKRNKKPSSSLNGNIRIDKNVVWK
jgi:hypothetical protein